MTEYNIILFLDINESTYQTWDYWDEDINQS